MATNSDIDNRDRCASIVELEQRIRVCSNRAAELRCAGRYYEAEQAERDAQNERFSLHRLNWG